MKKVLAYLKHTKKETILGPLFKMLEVCFELLVPMLVSNIVDNGIKNGDDADVKYIIIMCLIMFVFAVLGFVCTVIAQYFSAKAAVKLSTNLKNDLFKKIESLQYEELDELGNSTLITRMTSDINQVQTGVNMALRLLLRSPVVVFGAMIVAFIISVKAGLLFLIAIPILLAIIMVLLLVAVPLYRKSQDKLDNIVRLSRENLTGVRVIRAFNKQEDEIKKFNNENSDFTKSQLFVGKVSAITNPLSYALINLFIILIVYVGGIEVNVGNLTTGNVIALYSLASQILVEMIKLANLIMTISRSIASANRLEKILILESKLNLISDQTIYSNDYLLEFNHVYMNYASSKKNSLNDITFKVKEGETIGIIGGTGSGKTTLVNVLGHFYDINNGTILYKGKKLESYQLEDLRNDIAYVPQRAKLFKGTIKENLLWGNEKATDDEILEAINLAQGNDIILKKEKGIYEEVEQDGRNFSGGQKQRLCIARAILKSSKILILDDSSSALDYATDAKLRKSLKTLPYHPTIFIVSQRTSSIQHCDQIIVLDNGELVGLGKHDDLLKTCTTYKEIYDSQYKKENKK